MMYKNRTIKEIDDYYGLNEGKISGEYKRNDCIKIQKAFLEKDIELTLAECKVLYETYSDEVWCASWENGIDTMHYGDILNKLYPFLIRIINDRIDRISRIGEQLVTR